MRSHRGIKPFVCNECGLQFTVKSNWQRHVAEHNGTRSANQNIYLLKLYLFLGTMSARTVTRSSPAATT